MYQTTFINKVNENIVIKIPSTSRTVYYGNRAKNNLLINHPLASVRKESNTIKPAGLQRSVCTHRDYKNYSNILLILPRLTLWIKRVAMYHRGEYKFDPKKEKLLYL